MKPFKIILLFSLFCALLFVAFYKTRLGSWSKISAPNVSTTNKIVNSPAETSVSITDEELNQQIFKEGQDYIQEPRIEITGGEIILTGKIKKGITLPIRIVTVPTTQKNRLGFEVIQAKIGPVNAPKEVVEKIVEEATKHFANYKITNISVEEHKIILNTIKE